VATANTPTMASHHFAFFVIFLSPGAGAG